MIVNRIYHWARIQPDRAALIDTGETLTYAAFAAAIEATRVFLAEAGLSPRRTAIVIGHSHASEWLIVLALRALGATSICLHRIEDAEALGLGDVQAVIVTHPSRAAEIAALPAWRAVPVLAAPAARAGCAAAPADIAVRGEPPGGHILYTSGTTGTHKKVLWRAAPELRRLARIVADGRHQDIRHAHMQGFRLWTSLGLALPLASWSLGATVEVDGRPEMFDGALAGPADFLVALPAQVDALLAAAQAAPGRLAGRRVWLTGGFTPFEKARQLARDHGGAVTIMYGNTECDNVASSLVGRAEDHNWHQPSPGRRIAILADDGAPVAEGQIGALGVGLTDLDAQGYLDDAEATAASFRGGYFLSGDMATRRADGRIQILGRSADVLNLGGQKIAATPLEEAVERQLGIAKACLFTGLNAAGEEELVVALELAALPPRERLKPVAEQLGAWRHVRFEAVAAFPRTEGGMHKIRRDALRRRLWGDPAA